jgi:hypothetical protein
MRSLRRRRSRTPSWITQIPPGRSAAATRRASDAFWLASK